MCDNLTIRTSPNRFIRAGAPLAPLVTPCIPPVPLMERPLMEKPLMCDQLTRDEVQRMLDAATLDLRTRLDDITQNYELFRQTVRDILTVRDEKYQLLVDEFIKLRDNFKLETNLKVEQFAYIQKKLIELQEWAVENIRLLTPALPLPVVAPLAPVACAAARQTAVARDFTQGCVIRTSPRKY